MPSSLVTIICWACGKHFQVRTQREAPTPVYKGDPPAEPQGQQAAGKVARKCPHCDKTNMVPA